MTADPRTVIRTTHRARSLAFRNRIRLNTAWLHLWQGLLAGLWIGGVL